jgi:beta-fructofuranosidase
MTLQLPNKWVWDFWLVRDGTDYHAFYLQAPRSLGDPELRHLNASIGHAVSKDLRHWRVLPDALSAGPPGAWDDRAVWTGCVVQARGRWHMFYTGVSVEDDTVVQRAGLATSEDLIRWRKHPKNPLIEADPRYYEQRDEGAVGGERMWRDPWVFRHPQTGEYHALITARTIKGPADGRGVIGHARSSDLVRWETLPPLTEPGDFYALEVPQLTKLGDRYYLLFSTWAEAHSARRREETGLDPAGGTHYLVADDPLGPFRFSTHEFLVGDPLGSLYSGKLVEGPDGDPCFLAWRNFAPDGSFVGELDDPLPVSVDGEGNLRVERNSAGDAAGST